MLSINILDFQIIGIVGVFITLLNFHWIEYFHLVVSTNVMKFKCFKLDGWRGGETDQNWSPLTVEVSNSCRVEIETNRVEEEASEF